MKLALLLAGDVGVAVVDRIIKKYEVDIVGNENFVHVIDTSLKFTSHQTVSGVRTDSKSLPLLLT